MNTTTFYTIRMDTRQPTAFVLAPGATRPEKLEHFFDAEGIHKHMQDNFGPDVKQLPGSKFREEVERRATHTLEMQALLMQHGTAGQDLTSFYVYGTASRPVGTWAQIEGAVYIQVDRSQTGYYTYIVVPAKLDAETLESNDLVFVSHGEGLQKSDLVFKQYRKITPSRLRQLTEQDYRERNGVVQTREGQASFQIGDYLGRDAKGEFRVRRVKVERDFRRISEPDADGWANYQPTDVRRAALLPVARDLENGQHGEAGDYVVMGSDSQWIVERELFEAAYQPL